MSSAYEQGEHDHQWSTPVREFGAGPRHDQKVTIWRTYEDFELGQNPFFAIFHPSTSVLFRTYKNLHRFGHDGRSPDLYSINRALRRAKDPASVL